MRGSLTSLVRLSVFAGLGLCVFAVGLGRMVPPSPDLRSLGSNRLVVLPIARPSDDPAFPRLLDFDGGRLEPLPLAETDRFERAACSPWKDEYGEIHVVGRWRSISGRGDSSVLGDSGIARLGFPSGRVIDRVSSSIVPESPPCWFPKASPRILFAAGDGKLYRMSFAEASAESVTDSARLDSVDDLRSPRPIAWRDEARETDRLGDPSWPDLPALGGRLIVSLARRLPASENSRSQYSIAKLWSLSLSADDCWIESASPLVPAESIDREQRFASIGRADDGTFRLAYLTRRPGEADWTGRLATVSFEVSDSAPTVRAETLADVADHCLPIAPNFSADGLHVDFARRDDQGELLVKRVPLTTKPADAP